jgi:hypothetical protein
MARGSSGAAVLAAPNRFLAGTTGTAGAAGVAAAAAVADGVAVDAAGGVGLTGGTMAVAAGAAAGTADAGGLCARAPPARPHDIAAHMTIPHARAHAIRPCSSNRAVCIALSAGSRVRPNAPRRTSPKDARRNSLAAEVWRSLSVTPSRLCTSSSQSARWRGCGLRRGRRRGAGCGCARTFWPGRSRR